MKNLMRPRTLVYGTLVVSFCILISLTFAHGDIGERASYQDNDIVHMAEQIERLEARISTLEARLELADRGTAAPWDLEGGFKPDMRLLQRITPLTRWEKKEVRSRKSTGSNDANLP